GKDEDAAHNNHGSWYDVQATAVALFIGDRAAAKEIVERAKTKRIARQIEPSGKQPLELTRTKSFGYCAFNLSALTELATLGERVGVDLWHFKTEDGRGIRKALDWLLPYATGARKWPYEQISDLHAGELAPVLRRAAHAYHEPAYEEAVGKLVGGGGGGSTP